MDTEAARPKQESTGLVALVGMYADRGKRAAQEDFAAWLATPAPLRGSLGIAAALADGVGGARGGRVAAETTVRLFLDAHLVLDPKRGVRRNASAALDAANRWLFAQGQADANFTGMACTFTGIVLRGRQLHVLHVGDSRLYRMRDGVLLRMTTDHIPPHAELRHILTRAVGGEPAVRIDYVAEPARVHDRYLLCSDGVHGAVADRAILAELDRRAAPEETARRLVGAALDGDIGDNATALVLDVVGLPDPDRFDLETTLDALPIVAAPHTGAVVDGLRLDAMLSDGEYSRVFRAVRQADNADIIVKFPKPATGAAPLLRLAFLREAWIGARVRSPYVAEVIEASGETQSCLYTMMPYYVGETLEKRLRRAPPVGRAEGLAIAQSLAKSVAALHRAGVIHRDIKPDNIVLQEGGALKLLDLGVARLPEMEDFPSANVPGTRSYMAPELSAGAHGDARTDLFALAVTVFHMFTRAYPYGEMEAFTTPQFTHPPVSLLSHRPDLPAWLDAVLARGFAVNSVDRYEDVLEFAFALEHGALHAKPAVPRPRGLVERDPVRFWQTVAGLLAFLLLIAVLAGQDAFRH